MIDDQVSKAAELYKSGRRREASELLASIVEKDPRNADAWFGLAYCKENTEDKRNCLLKVLEIRPDHQKAKQFLAKIQPDNIQPIQDVNVPTSQSRQENQNGPKICENCGASIGKEDLFCPKCGKPQATRNNLLHHIALIKCTECGREISDKAVACPGCGAPVSLTVKQQSRVPTAVHYNRDTDTFTGTMVLMVKLSMRAVQALGWKLDQVNETLGLVTFQTGASMGSWSGVSCSLNIDEVTPNTFRVNGTGKQNLRGGQMIALDIGGEAQSKVRKAIEKMKQLVV